MTGRLVLAAGLFAGAVALADDWPAFRHDRERTAVTAEGLATPLAAIWVFHPTHAPAPAWELPKPDPVEGILELPRVRFDDAYHVAVSSGAVFFGSSSDHSVYAIDATTGEIRWVFPTGGPVRLAPALWRDRVLVGSDDGTVYCLRAEDGRPAWTFHAAPHDDRVLGHGKLVSLWPIRTGVLVDGDIAYFGAGIFPSEGVYLYAVRAEDGALVWKNDTCGESNESSISPQGYLLASDTTIYAPMGRTNPAAFDRRTGRFIQRPFFGKTVGGTFALLAGDRVLTGTEEILAYKKDSPSDRLALYPGRQIIVAGDMAYLLGDGSLTALNRKTYPTASLRKRDLEAKLRDLRGRVTSAKRANKPEATVQALEAQAKTVAADLAKVTAVASPVWKTTLADVDSLILAGRTLFAGGAGRVSAIDADSGDVRWSGEIEGCAKGLAVAHGRLFASSDTGAITCFAPGGGQGSAPPRETRPKVEPAADPAAAACAAAAESILGATRIRRGFALVIGCETGRLAVEIARRSDLTVYAVDPDPQKVAAARAMLAREGLLGARVCADAWPLDAIPYPDYFANLIVSEAAVLRGELPAQTAGLHRMLKPLGGIAYLGGPKVAPADARRWLDASGLAGRIVENEGTWIEIARGRLEGAGSWTHQYAEPGNTACGDERILRAPLGVLWFGGPGPARMVNRHARATAPLALDGRLFVEGENLVMAYDAYNGLALWERKIPGAMRTTMPFECGNLAADPAGIYVAARGQCLRLDPASGRTLDTFEVPAPSESKGNLWGYIARAGDLLYGTGGSTTRVGDRLFAIDPASGDERWIYPGAGIVNTAIAIADGRVLLARDAVTEAQRARAAEEGKGLFGAEARASDARLIVALDAKTGSILWEKAMLVPGLGKGALAAIARGDVLLFFGMFVDGHFWKEFFAGQFDSRRVIALSATDGRFLWSRAIGYRVRPLVVGETLHAEPWAFDLRTGVQRMRTHPLSGETTPWQFVRPGHHCGCPAACESTLIFRSWSLGYYDLTQDDGTRNFGAQRPGCWINAIPANGLLQMPEASAGCMCAFPNMCTVVFAPRTLERSWGIYAAKAPASPVRRLAVNVGAPGDRRDASGALWLAYPRPHGHALALPLPLTVKFAKGGAYFRENSELTPIAGTDTSWLFTSGATGLSSCVIPVGGDPEAPRSFRVRLAFVEPQGKEPGARIFDVSLQGEVVLKGLDIAREAGGSGRALIKEFAGVRAGKEIALGMTPAGVLAAVEVIAE
ncbi:MAG: PQQ-binding-like beta-propeller repeat protein [Planctomycetes bacterium]|nr:PQQ-binding-like beta-propeller repeat protein [Planctomycetota bacterium]